MGNVLTALVLFVSTCHGRDLEKSYAKTQFQLSGHTINAYVADSEQKRSEGLMFIKSLPTNTGMLFVFEDTRPLGFWMKNTLIPLSIGFFDDKGILIDVQEMAVASSLMELEPPAYQSRGAAAFALEMNQGWFDKNHVKVGVKLQLVDSPRSALLKSRLSTSTKSDQRRD